MGLPVPKVWSVQEIGGRWGVVFNRVEQASFAEQMLSNAEEVPRYLECMVCLHMRIHARRAIQFADLKARLADNIAATRLLDERQKRNLLDGIEDMPDGDRLCHGDFHPMNILGEASQPVIIDWPDARRGDTAADVCRSHLLMKLHAAEIATTYLDAYCLRAGMSRQAVLSWLPYVAAARLAEDVRSEFDDLLKIIDTFSRNRACTQ
jgi:Ser/Thr protein kinase RdoA (MazF antagonist)